MSTPGADRGRHRAPARAAGRDRRPARPQARREGAERKAEVGGGQGPRHHRHGQARARDARCRRRRRRRRRSCWSGGDAAMSARRPQGEGPGEHRTEEAMPDPDDPRKPDRSDGPHQAVLALRAAQDLPRVHRGPVHRPRGGADLLRGAGDLPGGAGAGLGARRGRPGREGGQTPSWTRWSPLVSEQMLGTIEPALEQIAELRGGRARAGPRCPGWRSGRPPGTSARSAGR